MFMVNAQSTNQQTQHLLRQHTENTGKRCISSGKTHFLDLLLNPRNARFCLETVVDRQPQFSILAFSDLQSPALFALAIPRTATGLTDRDSAASAPWTLVEYDK